MGGQYSAQPSDSKPGLKTASREVPVRILEVARRSRRRTSAAAVDHDPRAGALRLAHQLVDLRGGRHVLRERELGGARPAAPADSQSAARLRRGQSASFSPAWRLKNATAPFSISRPDDSLRGQAQTVPIEGDRPLEIVDAQGDEGDAWLHGSWSVTAHRRSPVRPADRARPRPQSGREHWRPCLPARSRLRDRRETACIPSSNPGSEPPWWICRWPFKGSRVQPNP